MGNEVFNSVLEATGLPKETIGKELERILSKKGVSSSNVTLEELRQSLSEYLKEVILKAKDTFDEGVILEEEIDPADI